MLLSFKSRAFAALAFTALFGAGEQVPVTPQVPSAGGAAERATAPARPSYKQVKGDITSRGATAAEIIPILEAVRAMATQGASQAGAAAVSEAVRNIQSGGSSEASIEIGTERVAVFSDEELMALAAWYRARG